jgi:hypothetical protein
MTTLLQRIPTWSFAMWMVAAILAATTTSPFAAEPAAASSERQEKSAEEVARELANPNNSLASLTFKNQYRLYTGDLPNADDQDN